MDYLFDYEDENGEVNRHTHLVVAKCTAAREGHEVVTIRVDRNSFTKMIWVHLKKRVRAIAAKAMADPDLTVKYARVGVYPARAIKIVFGDTEELHNDVAFMFDDAFSGRDFACCGVRFEAGRCERYGKSVTVIATVARVVGGAAAIMPM